MSSGPPAAPARTFSKGTMGLKFMQRVVASNHVPTSTNTTTVRKQQQQQEEEVVVVKREKHELERGVVESSTCSKEQDGQLWTGATTTSLGTRLAQGSGNIPRKKRRLITTSQSLLHFPSIQPSYYSPTPSASTSTSHSASTSTPPFPVMARYSYGGANEEIELLMNPQISLNRNSKLQTERSTKHETSNDSNLSKKKTSSINQLAKSITTTTTLIRRNDSEPSSRTKSRSKGKNNAFDKVEARMIGEADPREDEDAAGRNFSGTVDLELRSGFRKPAGMEGVKKRASTWGGKPSLERKRKMGADQEEEEEEEVVWGKRGDERAWDVGKVEEEESDDDDDEDDSSGSSESSDEE